MSIPTEAQNAAAATLVTQVKRPAFLEKLARDWNIVPQNPAQEQQLFQLADMLRAAQLQEQEKTAGTGHPFLSDAINSLEQVLSQEGISTGPSSQDQLVKAAAFELTQQNDIAYAALEYANYLQAHGS